MNFWFKYIKILVKAIILCYHILIRSKLQYLPRRINMDTFFEQLIKKKKETKDYILMALYILAVPLALLLLTLLYQIPLAGMLVLPLQVLVFYLAYKFITALNVEYEYAVTNGDIEIDKIFNKQKRKKLVSISSDSIVIVAPFGDGRIPQLDKNDVTDATSKNPDADVYCVVYEDSVRKLLIFEPNEKIINEIKKRNPRNVFLKD